MNHNVKRGRWGMGAAALLAALVWSPVLKAEDAADTADLYLALKCNLCHSLEVHEIARKSDKMKGPDLSRVGSRRTAEWMERYLLGKEKIEGKEHKKEFKGTKKELATLVKWLAAMKETPAP